MSAWPLPVCCPALMLISYFRNTLRAAPKGLQPLQHSIPLRSHIFLRVRDDYAGLTGGNSLLQARGKDNPGEAQAAVILIGQTIFLEVNPWNKLIILGASKRNFSEGWGLSY